MKRTSLGMLGLILMTALAVGAIWAAGTAEPAEAPAEDTQLAENEASEELLDTSPPAADVALCGPSLPSCNSGSCTGAGCQIDANSCESVDLGVRCCDDNGTTFTCPIGQTVHSMSCDCGTGGAGGFCNQTRTTSNSCG